MCVPVRLHSENSEPTMLISQTTPDKHPSTPPLCRWSALVSLPTLTEFQLVWCAAFVMCCSAPACCSITPLRASVHYTSISLVNIPYTQNICEHLHVLNIFYQTGLIRVDVRLELNGANGPLIVSRSSLCLYQAPTPPPNRWPGLTTPPSRQVLARLAPLVLVFAVFLLPR